MKTKNQLRWTDEGVRQVCQTQAGVLVGWYQPTSTKWGVFTPGRAGWSEQFTPDESEARQMIERLVPMERVEMMMIR